MKSEQHLFIENTKEKQENEYNYIEDLKIDALDIALQGNVSFIRVVPWNWVIKKGIR